jgi:hypothetical protein
MKRRLGACVLGALLLGSCATAKPEPSSAETVAITPVESGTAAAGTAARPSPKKPSLTTRESKAVAQMMTKVSALRGLSSSRPVPGVTLARDALVDRLREKALREVPPGELQNEGQLLELLGFAPPGFDYLGQLMHLLDSQLEGFYEPNDGTMYLAADLKGQEAQAALAHELVHALQDQNFDLKTRSLYRPGKGDETMALACLAEGEATSVMMDYLVEGDHKTALDVPERAIRKLMEASMAAGGVASVPHILQSTLIAPYIDGLAFVHSLRRKGGFSYVDQAWQRPPSTTEQILHVDKWERNEAAIAVAPPTAKALGPGFRMIDEDSFGELGFALAFEEWVGVNESRTLATGWGGDRSGLFAKGDELAMAVHLRYDDATAAKPAALRPDAFADRAFTKLSAALKRKISRPPVVDSADTICFERPDVGPIVMARRSRGLFFAAGPTQANGATRRSTGSCAQAQQWAAEVLGSMP